MDHYVDIRACPSPEIAGAHVLNSLGEKLHLALVAAKSDDIGVSFPNARTDPLSLGDTLRLHGSRARLEQLMAANWLQGVRDHVDVSAVSAVPVGAAHRIVRRVQTRSSAERIRRRQMKRHGLTAEEVRIRVPDDVERRLNLPFLSLRSRSTGQPFRLFIEQISSEPRAAASFNTYGLSQGATVPWF